ADTYVDANNTTTVYGSATGLQASTSPVRQAFLRFVLSGAGAFNVQSATLRLTVGTGSSDGSAVGGTLATLSDHTWQEATTTYAKRPTIDGPALVTKAKVSSKQVVDFDVLSV